MALRPLGLAAGQDLRLAGMPGRRDEAAAPPQLGVGLVHD